MTDTDKKTNVVQVMALMLVLEAVIVLLWIWLT